MAYDSSRIPFNALLRPVADAASALARADERLKRSDLREGCVTRADFFDCCASLWVDGELVHLEDLVFHDAGMGLRTPTHELNVALDVLRTRRRLVAQPAGWGLSAEGLRTLRGRGGREPALQDVCPALETKASSFVTSDAEDALAAHMSAIDAVIERSKRLLEGATGGVRLQASSRDRDPIVYEPDWDEDARLAEWLAVGRATQDLPAVLRAAVLLDEWNSIQVLQHAPWLGRLLVADVLRHSGAGLAHLPAVNVGLKMVPREERTSRSRTQRLIAYLGAIRAGAEASLKEHDRLLLAQQQMQRRLVGRRQSSSLPQLVDLVLSRPMVSGGMIAEALGVTPQGALKIAAELQLRELTGRGRFRAWGIL